jgi:hypothetical protein
MARKLNAIVPYYGCKRQLAVKPLPVRLLGRKCRPSRG